MFDKICAFATVDVFKLAKAAGMVTEDIYSQEEEKALLDKDVVEVIREEHWLEDVFGAQSRLQSEAWAQKVSTTANWIFNTKDIRKKLFAEAKVTPKH